MIIFIITVCLQNERNTEYISYYQLLLYDL